MKERGLYRQEQGLKAWTDIRREAGAEWIKKKESQWPEPEEQGFNCFLLSGGIS